MTALAVAAAGLRLLWLADSARFPFLRRPVLDAAFYDAWARALAAGTQPPETHYMSPLYAWWLAALYRLGLDASGARAIQCLLAAPTTLLVAALARRLGGLLAAVLAAALWAACAPSVFLDALLLGPALATLLAAALGVATVSACTSPRLAAVAGFLLGLLALERPNALALAPFVVLAAAANPGPPRSRATRAGACALGLVAALAPAALNNLAAGDLVLVSSNGGINFYLGNHAGATGAYSGAPGLPDEPAAQREAARRLAEAAEGRPLRPAEVSRHWTRRALAELARDPGRAARLYARKLLLLAGAGEPQLNFNFSFVRARSPLLAALPVGFGVLLPLAAGSVWLLRRDPAARRVAALVLVYLATLTPFFIAGRFRMAALPWLAALAGAGVASFARAPRPASALTAVLLAAALAVVSHLPGLRQDDAAMWNLSGSEAEAEGRREAAEQDYRRALAVNPGFLPARVNLARLELAAGRPQAAAGLLAGAEADPDAAYLLGLAWLRLEQPERAEAAFALAARGRPWDGEAWNALGAARARRGDLVAAREAFRRAVAAAPGLTAARENLERAERALAAAPREEPGSGR